MYLLYVDESGDPTDKSQEYFVMGAVSVFERQTYFLSEEFDKVQEKWFPGTVEPIEFHTFDIRSHGTEPWHSMHSQKRKGLLSDLCAVLENAYPSGVCLFGVALHKPSFPKDDPVERVFHELCGHFDAFLSRINTEKERDVQRGLMILDSSKYTGRLDKLLLQYRREGTRFGRVRNFADAPCFADSKTTRLLQAADLIAHAIFRRYERSDAWLFDRIVSRFDKSEGIIHGLTHMIAKYRECPCPACISRISRPRQ